VSCSSWRSEPGYSEDIDLDLTGVKPPNLEEKVDRVLDSPALRALLRVRDLEVVDPSKPKQTQMQTFVAEKLEQAR
jgi:hypothetical protein